MKIQCRKEMNEFYAQIVLRKCMYDIYEVKSTDVRAPSFVQKKYLY